VTPVVPPPPRRGAPRVALVIAIVISSLAVLGVLGIVGVGLWIKHKFDRDVSYEAQGTAKQIVVSYNDDDNPVWMRPEPVPPPWSKAFHSVMTTQAKLVVTKRTGDPGTVSCTIRIDGKVVASVTDDDIATCVEPED
jgi:hypothetical protein